MPDTLQLPLRSRTLWTTGDVLVRAEIELPCYFVGDPDDKTGVKENDDRLPSNLLGLTGVVDKVRIALDGKTREGALYGVVIVEKQPPPEGQSAPS